MTANAPWKITDVRRGLRLRHLGLSYSAISVVFREYHGLLVGEDAVRAMLRSHGAPPKPMGLAGANFRRKVSS